MSSEGELRHRPQTETVRTPVTGTFSANDSREKPLDVVNEKAGLKRVDVESLADSSDVGVLDNERELASHVISVHDDPSLNPWTFRSWFIGIGLSAFGGVLGMFMFPLEYHPR